MTQILKPGESVETEGSALVCRVEAFLGGGGQGEVYRATLGGQSVALKWYFPNTATPEQRASLETLVKSGAPNDKFLWPLDLARASNKPGFGYVMLLRDNRYKGLVDLMKRRIDPSFRALTTAGIGLAHSFLQLHSKGLCYRDISFGNVFFDPDTGDVLICDNDNVAVDGTASSGVLGTPRFMAPEVVRGQAMPSTQTDLFSLAVLLFYMLMTHHPLEGKKEYDIHSFDAPAMNKLYGEEPVFVFDPIDDSNRPVPNYHDNVLKSWLIYPRFLQNLFTRAFTDGIRDPNSRTRESEWRAALVQLRDAIVYCPRCSAENFYDGDVLREAGKLAPCWACGAEMQLPARMRIGKKVIMLNRDTYLYPHHIDEQRLYDFSAPIAAMTQHPRDPNVWGIKNLSSDNWVSTTATGSVNDVPNPAVCLWPSGQGSTLAKWKERSISKQDRPERVLCTIIAQYGPAICDDPRRCKALMSDLCGQYPREINLLVAALEEHVASDLRGSQGGLPLRVLLTKLVKRLQDNRGLSAEAAQWAVYSLAIALGVLSARESPSAASLNDGTNQKVEQSTSLSGQKSGERAALLRRAGLFLAIIAVVCGGLLLGSIADLSIMPRETSAPSPEHAVVSSPQRSAPYHEVLAIRRTKKGVASTLSGIALGLGAFPVRAIMVHQHVDSTSEAVNAEGLYGDLLPKNSTR